jgi:hypothetical protein
VHDLVVADGKDEVLAEGVVEPEGHLVVVMLPVDRVRVHVAEGVVHPPHVPLEAEAQPPASTGAETPGKAVLSSARS